MSAERRGEAVEVERLGLIADAHVHGDGGPALGPAVFEALADVELILALGDMGEAAGLDALARVAPVLGTRGMDDPEGDPRLAPRRVVRVAGRTVGALFDLRALGPGFGAEPDLALPADALQARLAQGFGQPVDVVAFAATHRPLVALAGGVLFANPGSATLPAQPGPRGGGSVLRLVRCGASLGVERIDLPG